MISSIAERLMALRRELDDELRACRRAPGTVSILGVSKKQPVEPIVEAAHAGLDAIGENYVQEAKAKFPLLPEGLQKHFIGHVQTNKAKAIVELFDVVQSVDRIEAALALGSAAAKMGKRLSVLVQLNISPAERFGASLEDAPRVAEAIAAEPALQLDGVMAIGPITSDRDEISRAFELAAKTFALIGGRTLSIGMSGDWREGVRAGSTMVRIGTALFGERRYDT
ncbi:MAG: YggS family pyridoxal phosphate-dependent enzyme [Candidatus Eremiobacteraeota bacterium]|nr:YggS family pyridoxal phosphate-dependent enzyme [Candidatus Eremiobacteraeota bacterium]